MANQITKPTDPRFHDIEGQRFGRLTVLSYAGTRYGFRQWNCICDCGNEYVTAGFRLRHRKTRECRNCAYDQIRTHGQHKTRTYRTWIAMRNRCQSETSKAYANYGRRGISFCKRWQKFENFLEDMGEAPEGLSIDRINNNGNYEPGNCRWSTRKEQCRNKRNNVRLTMGGETLTLAEWTERYGIRSTTMTKRIERGWSVERAITEPAQKHKRPSSH